MPLAPLFRSRASLASSGAAVPDGLRIYAVGDIHGRADLLDRMARLVAQDLRDRPCPEALTIFLGDYIDRGPDSAGVLDRLAGGHFPTALTALMGNHEDLLQGFLGGAVSLPDFAENGGSATLRSYGLDPIKLARLPAAAVLETVWGVVPETHVALIETLRLSASVGDYFFCHAGIRPGVGLDAQDPYDLLWIRDKFLLSDVDFGKLVVHGHTPVAAPEVKPNRIGIDTMAFASGTLTALVLEGAERRFLQTRR